MGPRAERLVTAILLALCLLLAAGSLGPRLLVSSTPILFEAPDLQVALDGAVRQPGTYQLPFGSRMADLLELAGGLTDDAEGSLVNPAALLGPDDRVFVPYRMGDDGEERISLNSAPPALLERLPGVGPATARLIVAGRPYARLEDLLRVRGIGEKKLERLRLHARL